MKDTIRTLHAADVKPRQVLGDISVVIPTLGRPILEECLGWIAAGSAWPGELIVVDQGSNGDVAGWIEALRTTGLNARHLPSSQKGKSAGINRALEQVRTRFVAVTDDDCFVDHHWLSEMFSLLRGSPERIVTGRVEPAGDSDQAFCVVTSRTPRVYHRPELNANPLIGGNMGVSMANVKRIGPFDEHPSLSAAAEDRDWGYRALRCGIPIVYAPDVMVRHYSWRDAGQRAGRYREYSQSQGAFYGKYLLSGDLIVPLQVARALVRGPVRWLRGSIKGDQDMIERGRADTLGLLPGILAGIRRRGTVER